MLLMSPTHMLFFCNDDELYFAATLLNIATRFWSHTHSGLEKHIRTFLSLKQELYIHTTIAVGKRLCCVSLNFTFHPIGRFWMRKGHTLASTHCCNARAHTHAQTHLNTHSRYATKHPSRVEGRIGEYNSQQSLGVPRRSPLLPSQGLFPVQDG